MLPLSEVKAALRSAGVTSSVASKGRPDRKGEAPGAGLRMLDEDTARTAYRAVQAGARPDSKGRLRLSAITAALSAAPAAAAPVNGAGGAGAVGGVRGVADALAEALAGIHAAAAPPPLPDVLSAGQRSEVESIALDAAAAGALDEERLRALVLSVVAELPPLRVEVGGRLAELPAVRHEALERILYLASAGTRNVLLVGPAGTGKSTIGRVVADVLGLPFAFLSLSAGMSESALLGRMLPTGEGGRWEPTLSAFARVYGQGGVMLLDELDAADANVLIAINGALANGHLALPWGAIVERHPDCVIIAAANTFGHGADREYTGRSQLDAATLDRFRGRTVVVDYSPAIERGIAAALDAAHPGSGAHALRWTWRLRAAVREHGLRRIVSTRTLVEAGTQHAAGQWEAFVQSLFADWTAEERASVGELAPDVAPPVDWSELARG